VIGKLDLASVCRFVEVILDARERGARIFFIGNGGSAATAAHFANDVAIGSKSQTRHFRALSLADNLATMSAIANDHGYAEVFVRQLRVQMAPGDVVVAISASGNSANVVRAIEYANANGGKTVALTGFDGGTLKRIAQVVVHVPTKPGEYGPTEDVHMILDHMVGAFLIAVCRSEAASAAESAGEVTSE
jgi:D-sedoheptulose 7-phosphate isomerase